MAIEPTDTLGGASAWDPEGVCAVVYDWVEAFCVRGAEHSCASVVLFEAFQAQAGYHVRTQCDSVGALTMYYYGLSRPEFARMLLRLGFRRASIEGVHTFAGLRLKTAAELAERDAVG